MSHLLDLAALASTSAVSCADSINDAICIISDTLRAGHKILVCGNGGSAADAGHFSAEFVGRYMTERQALPALDMSSLPAITAIGNDYGFEFVFARQIEALGNPGDVLVIISTSGRSPNLVEAAMAARRGGIAVVALTGSTAHHRLVESQVWCRVPSSHTAHIQEVQIAILHAICEGVEQQLKGED